MYDTNTKYYYYAPSGDISNLTREDVIAPGGGPAVAEYVYLDASSSAELYGKQVELTLTVEAVQASNNAYKSVWGL